ncbi:MAG TPA: flagellar basal body rod protein FlgC [Terriglobales bacterium]|nr:flagellar basal body rod protein FlgC [Terriglobales bacterium]
MKMNLFGMLELSGGALHAERQRAEVVASNMANLESTRTPEGGPYRRRLVVFRAQRMRQPFVLAGISNSGSRGVRVDQVAIDPAPPLRRFEPGHPDADASGYVSYPAINPVEEMADLLGAVRAYELNSAAVQATKTMIAQAIDILR